MGSATSHVWHDPSCILQLGTPLPLMVGFANSPPGAGPGSSWIWRAELTAFPLRFSGPERAISPAAKRAIRLRPPGNESGGRFPGYFRVQKVGPWNF